MKKIIKTVQAVALAGALAAGAMGLAAPDKVEAATWSSITYVVQTWSPFTTFPQIAYIFDPSSAPGIGDDWAEVRILPQSTNNRSYFGAAMRLKVQTACIDNTGLLSVAPASSGLSTSRTSTCGAGKNAFYGAGWIWN